MQALDAQQKSTLLAALIPLIKHAGEAILAVYNAPETPEVSHKQDKSPLTQADLAAHHILVEGLQPLLPEVPVLSEESRLPDYELRGGWHRYWLIDPLDGTKEFVNRNGEFTVNIALIDEGVPVLGLVYVPVKGVLYFGGHGIGAHKDTGQGPNAIKARTVKSALEAGESIALVASRNHGAEAVQKLMQRLEADTGKPVLTRNMGSSLKLCLVAEGLADLYPRLAPTSEWDTAAAQAIVEAAGGVVVDEDFKVLRYNQKADILNPFFYVIGDTKYPWQALL
ncbi:3'(2'),5'-bisphosphate nucleotidase CysQ [Simiduia sp. 21SJ11W-1]|uniref:3'(2'),5'-bisphosphate nucleotidase CysQ n=1 Tax=Simiduia sp. 21SJ11W-1 TaxID=2909669 RepID=UPI00209FFEF5|nr:3'(2'),5'-bisphosphate nucleotidase CysQ [Simiduia sp. 21SJ11W-1]UTA48078.1 3'(2'),5'-bisphosphate nucleotidase CysQ [Simiduia sp. 21SJ11W-1]